jgi:hypothetical protein
LTARKSLSEADVLVRAAVPLVARRLQFDAPLTLAKLDARTEFLWHCHRALEDFWGPAPGQPESFFVGAARRCFEGADAAWPEQPDRAPLAASLVSLRNRREAAAEPKQGVLPVPG